MTIAALIISVFALLASASSVFYTRRQAIHAGDVVAIERQRSHAERTPILLVRSADEYHDDSNQHETAVNITNRASFSLHRISARAITDRPGKHAIIGVVALDGRFVNDRPGIVIDRLEPGRTSSFEVVLAWAGERSQSGVLSLEMHDASGELWIIEVELEFPTSPTFLW